MLTLRSLALALLVAVLPTPWACAQDEEERKRLLPHADTQVAPALEAYRRDAGGEDLEKRLRALRALGRWRHKEVLKELKRVLGKEPDLELKAVAAEGLGHQSCFAAEAGRALADFLEAQEGWASQPDPQSPEAQQRMAYEARVLVACWGSVGALGWKEAWKEWKDYIDHEHDDVASAAITAFGRLKEYRALPSLLEWFNIYPDGVSWDGGSVRVDTGAAGDKDQKAAQAAWKAKYGGRAKKARPAVVDALLRAVRDITGQEFTKPAQLKQWMDENKALLKKHGA
ncbi:MAG: HEAT repeat domain-containing protein [Planctomycetia bacterium]